MKRLVAFATVALVPLITTLNYAAEAPRSESDRLAVARAFVELMEQGYPGPELSDLDPWSLLKPLSLLGGTSPTVAEEDVRLRACLLTARRLRAERLSASIVQGEGWSQLVDSDEACAGLYESVHANHPQFCIVAAAQSARATLSAVRRRQLKERCAEPIATISRWEEALEQDSADAPEPNEMDALRSTFEQRYQEALATAWWRQRELDEAQRRCLDKSDCSACLGVLHQLYATGRAKEAAGIAAAMESTASDAGSCRQTLAIVAAWRHRFEDLEKQLSELTEPLPDWARELSLYSQLQSLATGTAGGQLPDFAGLFSAEPKRLLLRFAAEALARSARALNQPAAAPGTLAWLVKTSIQPEILVLGEPALAVGLTFLWALAPQATVFDFMDEVLRQAGDGVTSDVLTRVGIEVLSVATRESDVERLQQSLVILRRVVNAQGKSAPCHEAEFFLRFAEWLDGTLAGQKEAALRRYQDRLNVLRANLPRGAAPRIRGLTVLNLLAATLVRRAGTVHALKPYLDDLETRNVAYHILWVNQFLEQRQTARARAALRWCEAAADVPEAEAACQLWRAYLHELVGEPALADVARERAGAILGETLQTTLDAGFILLVEGERKVGFTLSDKGRLEFRSRYSPAFFLVPLPRLGTTAKMLVP